MVPATLHPYDHVRGTRTSPCPESGGEASGFFESARMATRGLD